ncbi:MAG: 16S rRNA (cytosine(1402)-N(4))-methyltransferase [Nitrospiraceae bacterium]
MRRRGVWPQLWARRSRILPSPRPIHCATRTFQALRIAVNRELEVPRPALRDAVDILAPGGRVRRLVHSLEDRIVKTTFRALASGPDASLQILHTKKPVMASEVECCRNPRSRSAKLRVGGGFPKGAYAMKAIAFAAITSLVLLFVWERVDIVRIGYQIERLKGRKWCSSENS